MRIIAGEWKGRGLKTPKGKAVRPTSDRVREAWLGSIGARVEGATVLDLFAGSGALGLEALSRGAHSVVFVEQAKGALDALRANIRILDAEDRATVVRGDAVKYARRLEAGAVDLALADPPYDRGLAAELVELFRSTPFAREFWLEHRSNEVLPEVPGAAVRRYGDTTLTVLRWTDDTD